jgi:hypothetical protein
MCYASAAYFRGMSGKRPLNVQTPYPLHLLFECHPFLLKVINGFGNRFHARSCLAGFPLAVSIDSDNFALLGFVHQMKESGVPPKKPDDLVSR